MVINKRAQFFLLAAVIISAVVISFGVSVNRAVVSNEPKSFYDFGNDVKRETTSVLNYEVYKGFTDNDNLTNFVNLLADDVHRESPNAGLIFIYGNNENITVVNYGNTTVNVQGTELQGENTPASSMTCVGALCNHVGDIWGDYNNKIGKMYFGEQELKEKKNVSIDIGGQNIVFPLSNQKKVIFIMQKEVNNESFITIG